MPAMPASTHQDQGRRVISYFFLAGRLMGYVLPLHSVFIENNRIGSLKNRPKTSSHQPKQVVSQELSLSTTKTHTLYYHY